MWKKIERLFEKTPIRLKVTRLLLELGLSIKENDEIYCGPIEIPPTKIARALGIDHRTVMKTVEKITRSELKEIFARIKPAGTFLGDVAEHLGFSVTVITADPRTVGIVAKILTLIANEGIKIRQIIAEDPELFPEPKLTILTERTIPGEIIQDFLKIKGIKDVTVY